ncbi:MAG: 2'-5'-RNA ligase [Firmicutes bacterium ADurb.Bin182]|nr:MAG: 2'-5'-RNA ligase [Firmicutes bacterium ADurb.Bin182]
MRLFIAIELPKTVRSELGNIRDNVRSKSFGGRFVPEENMHVTLHFIGESSDLASAAEAMRRSVSGIRPFTLSIGEYGFFQTGEGKTYFVTVEGDIKELNSLYESLQSALGDCGFKRAHRKYKPHITLGRAVKLDNLSLEKPARSPNTSFTVSSIVLFESTQRNGQMCYTPLHKERF